MFTFDFEDTSQSELEIDFSGSDIFGNKCSADPIDCRKFCGSKSDVLKEMQLCKNISNPKQHTVLASTSRFENIILNGSASVPTEFFICHDQHKEVEIKKILNRPQQEESNFDTGDQIATNKIAHVANEDQLSTQRHSIVESSISPTTVLQKSNEERQRRFVMAVAVGSVIGVTVVIMIVGKF